MLDSSFFFQHSKESKVARTQIWRTSWMGKAFKLRIGDFFGNLPTIEAHAIVHMDDKLSRLIPVQISYLLIHNVE
jgi:hypothetical protein